MYGSMSNAIVRTCADLVAFSWAARPGAIFHARYTPICFCLYQGRRDKPGLISQNATRTPVCEGLYRRPDCRGRDPHLVASLPISAEAHDPRATASL